MNRKKGGLAVRRSGTVELLRFLFCVAVLLFHANKYFLKDITANEMITEPFRLTLCTHGAIGVEFFFIVSGFLMAKNAYKKHLNDQKLSTAPDIGVDTVQFLWGKLKAILPYHVPAFIVAVVSWLYLNPMDNLRAAIYVINSIPSFFLVHMSGIGGGKPNHVEWYISAMLLSMLLIYPLLRKNYSVASRVLAPIFALFLLGWMAETGGRVTDVSAWTGICYRSIFRGISELCFGVMAFELVQLLDSVKCNWFVRFLLTVLELTCAAAITWFILVPVPNRYEITAVFVIFLLVILAFSKQTLLGYLLNNPISDFLGKLSLPIYLSQVACINYINYLSLSQLMTPEEQVELCIKYTLALALVTMVVGDILGWLLFGNKRRRRREGGRREKHAEQTVAVEGQSGE